MKFHPSACSAFLLFLASTSLNLAQTQAFVTTSVTPSAFKTISNKRHEVSLNAIGVLARKAKEMDIKKYLESGEVEPEILEKLEQIKAAAASSVESSSEVSEFQSSLTKRKGTLTVIAEYKRRQDKGGFIDEIYDPEILSPTFREFGASAIAVMADERMGGCTYDDIKVMKKEQEIAIGDMPGPLSLVSSDLIVDDVQIARSAAAGAQAVVLTFNVVGEARLGTFIKSCKALDMDAIVSVDNMEEAQKAVDAGATILMVTVSTSLEELSPKERGAALDSLNVPEGTQICRIAHIVSRDDKGLQEVEDAWICRDNGFQAIWASDFLYKSGNDAIEHPGAIIKSMKAKSSVKWASPKAKGGKGEGAREYLGDILM